MVYEFKPIDYKDLKIGDAIRFDYAPLLHRNTAEFEGFVDNISGDFLRVSMSNPSSPYLRAPMSNPLGSFLRLLFVKPRKDFERERISNLRRLEVVVLEDSKETNIPF